MAKLSIWDEGKIQRVLVPSGKFDYSGEQRFAVAPIALLSIPKTTSNVDRDEYVMTMGTGARGTDADTYDSDDRVLVQSLNTFGYVVSNDFIMDGAMGDFRGQPDNWKGVHEFHFI